MSVQKYESKKGNSSEVSKTHDSTPLEACGVVWPYFTMTTCRSGTCEITTHDDSKKGPGVTIREKHASGTGRVVNHAGELEERSCNGYNQETMGPISRFSNGKVQESHNGTYASLVADRVSKTLGIGGAAGAITTASSLPPRGTDKNIAERGGMQMMTGDFAFFVTGNRGDVSTNYTNKATGNFTIGGGGTGSITSQGDMACGSEGGCVQMGGRGAIISAQDGPLSAFATGKVSVYSQGGGRIVIDGDKVYLNGPPPVTTDQVVAATKGKGNNKVAKVAIRSRKA